MNITRQKLQNGVFGKKELYYTLLKTTKKTEDYYIFFHGAFGTSFKEKYLHLAEKLTRNNIGNVLLFESTRKIYTHESEFVQFNIHSYAKTFQGKTFSDELSDVKTLFDFFLKELITDKSPKIHLVGASLGGILISYLIKPYKKSITSITLLNSGLSVNKSFQKKPILNTLPTPRNILKNYADFTGILSLIQGTKDTTIPQKEAQQIILQAKKSSLTKLLRIKGADHTLGFIDGKPTYAIFEKNIYEVLANIK